jgi:hypothetical protein
MPPSFRGPHLKLFGSPALFKPVSYAVAIASLFGSLPRLGFVSSPAKHFSLSQFAGTLLIADEIKAKRGAGTNCHKTVTAVSFWCHFFVKRYCLGSANRKSISRGMPGDGRKDLCRYLIFDELLTNRRRHYDCL